MPQASERWTAEQVRALPADKNRYEVIDGVLLVTPAPGQRHQRLALELVRQLMKYCDGATLELRTSPAEVELDSGTLLQPDVFVLAVDPKPTDPWSELPAPILAIEVLSPTTAYADRVVKRDRLLRAGSEYWIADPGTRVIERWRPGEERPEIASERLEWRPVPDGEPLVLDVRKVFEETRVAD